MSTQDVNGHNGEQIELPVVSEKTKEQWVIEGIAYYKAKSYTRALLTCEQVIQLDPNDALGYYNKGLTLAKLKRYEEALDAYDHAIRLDPYVTRVYTNKGNALAHLKRYQEALATFEQALQLDPSNKVTRRNVNITKGRMFVAKGDNFFKLKRYKEAFDAYKQALQFDQTNEAVYSHRGKALLDEGIGLFELGRFNEAYFAFESAVLFGPGQPDVCASLRETLLKTERNLYDLKHYGLAFVIRKAALLFNEGTNSCITIGKINRLPKETLFVQEGNSVQPKPSHEQTKRYDYTDDAKEYRAKVANLLREAKRLYEVRNYGQAGLVYEQLAHLDPNYEDIYKDKGRDLLLGALDLYLIERYEEALDAYKQALQFDPSNARVSIVRGRTIDKLKHAAQTPKDKSVLSSEQIDIYFEDEHEDDITINYNELMGEGYDGKSKVLYTDDVEDETADPDEYDPYYNQYDGRDLGDVFEDFF